MTGAPGVDALAHGLPVAALPWSQGLLQPGSLHSERRRFLVAAALRSMPVTASTCAAAPLHQPSIVVLWSSTCRQGYGAGAQCEVAPVPLAVH